MKRKIIVALLLILTMICSLFAFTGCGDKESGEKQVPVYQGMTITNANTATMSLMSSSYRSGGIMLLSANKENNGDNGNHNGHYKGDHTDRNDAIDEENPYPDNADNENIEEEIKSSLNVVGSPDTIYYAEPNQDIYINIHIDNPDSFEIMSFTLNGKKYSSYMFEEGSDMETIVLKYNVGETSGIVEYTIDAIKYIDGTEIEDVIIDGNKTVMAGVRTQNQFSANISNLNIGTNSLTFNANIKDNNALIEFSGGALKAVLYDGFSIVAEKDLVVGDNTVNFDGLKTNTLYQYAVVGYYDDLSGNGFGMNVLYKDAFYTNSVVLFDNITIGQESFSFSFLWHEDHQNQAISALKLYKGDNFVKNVDVSATSVNELLSNTTYKLVAEYPNGNNTESIYIEFTTLAKETPEISVVSPTKTQTSVGFEISKTDAENVGAVTKIELVHASGTVVANSLDQRTFANLLSNNAYTVKVTYVYDLNDGEGEHTVTKELAITTLAKTAPSFVVKNESITTNSMNAQCDITDVDNILSSYKVELYKDNTFVSDNSDKAIDFTGLDYYTDYTVKITYTYDLNDGSGNQTAAYSYAFKTLPYIDVTECNIANTSAVSEGETIFMSVNLDNPLGMTIESVFINGEMYNVTGTSTKNKIFVEIVYNGQFVGGDTYLKIDRVNAKIDNTTLSVEPKSELSDNVFINGKLEVLDVYFVNANFEKIEWGSYTDSVHCVVRLINDTGYSIDEIKYGLNDYEADQFTINSANIHRIDNSTYYFSYDISLGWNTIYFSYITYSNKYIQEKTVTVSNWGKCFGLKSDTIFAINTVEDLKKLEDYCYYELTSDISLKDTNWVPYEFNGVINGNGYTINDLALVTTYTNQDITWGLFSKVSGIIENLTMSNVTYLVSLQNTDGNRYEVKLGGFCGAPAGILSFKNCHTTNSTISVMGAYKNSKVIIGGFVGGDYMSSSGNRYCEFIESSCTDYISINNAGQDNQIVVGGFVGSTYPDSVVFEKCIASTTFDCNSGHIAGFVGYFGISGGEKCFISNCISNSKFIQGGSMFFAYSCGDLILSNTYNLSITNDSHNAIIVENFVDFSNQTIYSSNSSVNIATILLNESYFINVLKWSDDIWDFSELDVENGKYPKLKQ